VVKVVVHLVVYLRLSRGTTSYPTQNSIAAQQQIKRYLVVVEVVEVVVHLVVYLRLSRGTTSYSTQNSAAAQQQIKRYLSQHLPCLTTRGSHTLLCGGTGEQKAELNKTER
jgi:heme/copper-type cytochrome/quinol oxidase subunit 4